MNKAANEVTAVVASEPGMRVLMIRSCPSLSGLSEITGWVGCPTGSDDVSNICFRIGGNSGGGKYNADWISIAAIEKALAVIPPDQPFSAAAFAPIYPGRSINSAGFLGSILLSVGLIARAPESRSYVRHTATEFWAEVQTLIRSGVDLSPASMQPDDSHCGSGTPEPAVKKQRKAASKSDSAVANG